MDVQRAQQIINSRETIEVLHNGLPVWIEGVTPGSNTAKVRSLHGKEATLEVPVAELMES
ncbi:small acid-soluble spore protein H (minor) [Desulfotomaculum arcticum]|uniref:Small acid-soluble spore protein H (Minor) n=1 Tax=Desulfotruncus arcticus DSM 17038 TaxID=1121424 RepID=A0A1I2V483_9FIRM|nr:H-type small acid-soluble spore protein [Desulfotruncus arcticus]SFG83843.1 small acid-soluble spore protein H (minor) [Desulfotomaculum arcticum] [Desulfotruncus arcticus DSM 17038]